MKNEAKKADEQLGVDLAQLAAGVHALQTAVASMRANVKDRLIVLMLHDITGLGKREIQSILDAIPEFARVYLKAKP
jgi:hypothetical protein